MQILWPLCEDHKKTIILIICAKLGKLEMLKWICAQMRPSLRVMAICSHSAIRNEQHLVAEWIESVMPAI